MKMILFKLEKKKKEYELQRIYKNPYKYYRNNTDLYDYYGSKGVDKTQT